MGDSKGHLTNGVAFCAMGLWHLFNLLKLPDHTSRRPIPLWFHSLELLLVMLASFLSLSMEIFTGFLRHSPFAPDGSILNTHIPHFEHSIVALAFFVYALSALLLHSTPAGPSIATSLAATAFALELLLFHLHSTDHTGLEGHYHSLFQLLIFASFASTVVALQFQHSFLVGFFRSIAVLLQGLWLIVMGYALWTPALMPHGCFLRHNAVRCPTDDALKRAKGITTVLFCGVVLGTVALAVAAYLVVTEKGGDSSAVPRSRSRMDDGDEIEAKERVVFSR